MSEIQLTQGKVAIVSEEDYEYLTQWKWHTRNSNGRFYAARQGSVRTIDGNRKQVTILMHRVILARMLSHEAFETVDHIDGDGLNNRRENIRTATYKQNCENLQGVPRNSTTGIRGVCWHKKQKQWTAKIYHNKKQIHLGSFDDIREAEKAAIAGRNKYFTHHTS